MQARFATITILLLLAVAGCDEPDALSPGRSTAAPAPLPAQGEIEGDGVIRGRVVFNGVPPVMAVIENRHCHSGAEAITEEHVVVNENGTLRNVFVYITDGPAVDGSQLEPALLDQVDCRYTPHVVAVQTDQPLRIRSSDPTFHNVHWRSRHNPPANFGLTSVGAERTVAFRVHEFIRVRCDVHPWMNAVIGVFDNPFFAVTGEEGSYEIAGLPPGEYTLVAWHETYGPLEHRLAVDEAQIVQFDFSFQQP